MHKDEIIFAECPLFVCRECHTKTGHPHQHWCTIAEKSGSGCAECLYRQERSGKCTHPYRKKAAVKYEEN
ncbi:MAG: hypothetical protein IJT87_03925 [Ruminiclostridium sp.]|nr:hypothetical protein [Ruminiclostridium sp.]